MARRYVALERRGNTLQATALVHEAYVRLARTECKLQNAQTFVMSAVQVMRHILVDHARARRRQKRGCGEPNISVDGLQVASESSPEILELDEALQHLANCDPRKSSVIELLFFGGLTYNECAGVLEISTATLHRELRLAKAWLCRELKPVAGDPEIR